MARLEDSVCAGCRRQQLDQPPARDVLRSDLGNQIVEVARPLSPMVVGIDHRDARALRTGDQAPRRFRRSDGPLDEIGIRVEIQRIQKID